jgi:hypothetical protein
MVKLFLSNNPKIHLSINPNFSTRGGLFMKIKFILIPVLAMWTAAAWSQTAVIRSGSLKVFDAPQANARLLMRLSEGDTVKVIEQRGNWAKLQLPGKRVGWMQLSGSTSAALFKKNRGSPGMNVSPQAPKSTEQPIRADTLVNDQTAEQISLMSKLQSMEASEQEMQSGRARAETNTHLNLGISFSLGAVGESFAYSGRFMYRTLPKIFIEGSFQHVPGDVAASLLVHSNLLYDFSVAPRWDGWITGGVGVISTSPTKTVGAKSVSNMEVNYGIGVRRYLKRRTYLRGDLRQFSVMTDNGTKNYIEFAFGIVIGVR